MNATTGVIGDGVLWANTPLFAAAHLWSWHPLWAAGIWTAYGIIALFPQGEALLSKMANSPVHYNPNPLHSPMCGLQYGSVVFDVPTNSSKNQVTSVFATPVASTSDSEYTTQPSQQDKSSSVVTVNTTRLNNQPALVPTSHWNGPDKSNSHSGASVISSPGSAASFMQEVRLQIPSSLLVSGNDQNSRRSSHTPSFSTSSRTTQSSTAPGLGLYERPNPTILDDVSTRLGFSRQGTLQDQLIPKDRRL